MGVDVIVVNYKTPDDMEKFVQSYEQQLAPDAHLWMVNVDPAPTDAKVVLEASNRMKNSHAMVHLTNVGYGTAVNSAAVRGEQETIAIFNADVVLTPGSLSNCCSALQANPDWGVLGPRQVNSRRRLTHAGIFGRLDAPQHRGWQQQITEEFTDVKEAVTVSGAAYFIKRSVWQELTDCPIFQSVCDVNGSLGAFLPTPHYYEETWCSYHAQAHGYKVMYYGPVTVIHEWHKASPVGGYADQAMPTSRALFCNACDVHGIDHD